MARFEHYHPFLRDSFINGMHIIKRDFMWVGRGGLEPPRGVTSVDFKSTASAISPPPQGATNASIQPFVGECNLHGAAPPPNPSPSIRMERGTHHIVCIE